MNIFDLHLSMRTKASVGLLITCCLLFQASCLAQSSSLLLQQTPADGGYVTPSAGVHDFEFDTEVTLTAVAKPGYQFVYWIGDVSSPTSNSTSIYLDSPKIVIAVFERTELTASFGEFELEGVPAGAGRGGMMATAADYSRQGGSGGGAKRPSKYHYPTYTPDEQQIDESEFPVPDDSDIHNFPVPDVPEPGTIFLLGTAIPFLLARKRRTNR